MIDPQTDMQELRETLPNTKSAVIENIKETLETSREMIQKAIDQGVISAEYAEEKMQTKEGWKELYQCVGINPDLIYALVSDQMKSLTEAEGEL